MTLGDRSADAPLCLEAWAKVNLTLQVTGRRADGYHELDSLVVFAGIGDTLEIAPAKDLSFTADGPFAAALGDPASNLVLRAAAALRARGKPSLGARLRLTKRLPVAAGLGGGSADAAAALRGLNDFWRLGVSPPDLAALGAALGADVPVCLSGRPSFMGGVGERLDPAPELPPVWLVLVNPGVPLATAAVFRARRGPFSRPLRWRESLADPTALAERLKMGRNDLEAPATALAPVVGTVLAALRDTRHGLLARMSGSGATCFGLYSDEEKARAAAARLAKLDRAWWVRAAPVLSGEALLEISSRRPSS